MKALKCLPILLSLIIISCEGATEPKDCAGVAGGTAVLDECEICSGGTTNLTACTQDCAGVWGGDATTAECEACTSGVFDCAGTCDGTATTTECDACTSKVFDCASTCDGTAVEDECGVCVGGTTELTACPTEPSGTYIMRSWIYQDDIDCSDGTNGCESNDCSETYLTFTDNSYIFQESDPYCDGCGHENCDESYTTEETCLAVEGAVWKTQTDTGTWTLNADNEIIGLIDEDEEIPEGATVQWIFNQNTNTIVFTQIDPTHTNSSGEVAPFCMLATFTQ